MNLTQDSSIRYLKGVGAKRAEYYENLGVSSVEDLLYHFPRRYIDLTNPYSIMDSPLQEVVPVKAKLMYKSSEQHIRKGLSIFKLTAEDYSGTLEITIFNAKYLVSGLKEGTEYIFFGKVEGTLLSRSMASPQIYPAQQKQEILPVYPQTAGINSGLIRNNILQVLKEMPPVKDSIPEHLRIEYNIPEINASFRNIHFPSSMTAASVARSRFIFQELLVLSCALYTIREVQQKDAATPLKNIDLKSFYQSLPYTPTDAQYRCIKEITSDMELDVPMNRLLQGDVGSGKTLVAAAAVFFAALNSVQSALMVPTEILAEQHYDTFTSLLSPFNIRVELLTGSTKAAKRREILAGLEDGSIHLCVGTHALLSDKITYYNLGLVITDEQHRFGVAQRATLSQKSKGVHVLVMSATPIPRTLSLIIYGDLSVSVLDEMPPGRQPVDTLLIDTPKLARARGFIRKNIDKGQQAYIVCPLIETGEIDMGLRPAVEYHKELAKGDFKNYRVGLLHGKMKSADKEKVMRDFKDGKIQVLVSTTVVEVGVDVPNATIIMIENAERFGLSQLHQLRGRVGRGREKSYCILVSDAKSKIAMQRLGAMKAFDDGFKLAEYDLKLRGPGDFFGFRQHGLPTLKVADLAEDMDILEKAQKCAQTILEHDPTLGKDEHGALKLQVDKMLEAVGDRPN